MEQNISDNIIELDAIINKLLVVRKEKPGKLVNLTTQEIYYLIEKV